MTPERYRRLGELFDAALDRPAAERSSFLDQACHGDTELRGAVEGLLENYVESDPFLAPPQAEPVPSSIGPYTIRKLLGEGGMGTVYMAEQFEPIRRDVALKVIKPGMGSKSVIARFESEKRALAMLHHPYIAQVFDAGTTSQGLPYFAMELVEGTPITLYCERQQLGVKERLDLFVQVCQAIQYAHQKGILHRDIKPSNILVRELEGKPIPKVIDFGLAKALDAGLNGETSMTELGTILGTLEYMSPEQADLGRQDIDTRSDVYSLGVLLYQLLAGKTPLDLSQHPDQGYITLLKHIQDDETKAPSTQVNQQSAAARNRVLRGDLDAITLKALEKDRARRYASPGEFASDIGRYLRDEPVEARPASTFYRTGKYARRHWLAVSFAAVVALLLAGVAITQSFEVQRIRRERDRADRVTSFITNMFKVSNPSESRGNEIRAREILDKASTEIDTGLKQDPETQAQMMQFIGNVYLGIGLYPKADALLQRALDIQSKQFGVKNPETLKSALSLAETWNAESRYREAEKLARATLTARQQNLGADHRDTLSAASLLANVLDNEGRYAEAEKLSRQVVDAATKVFGVNDTLTREAASKLAIDLAYQGKFAEAEKTFRELWETDQRLLGPDHPETLRNAGNLASTLLQEGKYAEAEQQFRMALELNYRVFGPENPHTLTIAGNLALTLESEQRHAEAEKLFRETLQVKRRVMGAEHRSTLVTAGNLSDVLIAEGKYSEAEQLIQSTLDAERRTLGPAHSDFQAALGSLALVLAQEKKYPAAERVARESVEGYVKVFGADHPDTAYAVYILASVLAREEKPEEALRNLKFAFEHRLVADMRQGLGKDPNFNSLHGDPGFAALARQ